MDAVVNVGPPPRSLDEVILGNAPHVTRVEFTAGPAEGETLPVTGGSIEVNMEAPVRRAGSLSIAGSPEWISDGPTHPLDVRAGSRLQVWQGVVDDLDNTHWWSQGVFCITQHGADEASSGIGIDVPIADLSYLVKKAKIGRRWVAIGTDRILASVIGVIKEVAPWVEVDIDLSDDLPFGGEAVLAQWGDDVWDKSRELLRQNMSRDLHFDRNGVLVAPPLVNPVSAEPLPLLGLVVRNVQVDLNTVVNVTGCRWEEARPDDAPEGWVPKGGVAEWRDTTSSTSVTSPLGVMRALCEGDTSLVHTPEHAAYVAQAYGITRVGLQQSATGSKVPDPRDDVGAPASAGGTVHIVSRLGIDLGGGETSVDLGAARPDIALMMAARTRPPQEYTTTEIVTSLVPLRSVAVDDPEGSDVIVTRTDALAGVEVGDPITVLHKGAGVRVGVAVLVKKNLADKHAGEKVGTVGGADVTVGGNTQLRVRASGGSYANFSGGDATITVPTPDTSLDWSYSSQSLPATLGDAGSVTLAAFNEDRRRTNALINAVNYINGRLVNLDANN